MTALASRRVMMKPAIHVSGNADADQVGDHVMPRVRREQIEGGGHFVVEGRRIRVVARDVPRKHRRIVALRKPAAKDVTERAVEPGVELGRKHVVGNHVWKRLATDLPAPLVEYVRERYRPRFHTQKSSSAGSGAHRPEAG